MVVGGTVIVIVVREVVVDEKKVVVAGTVIVIDMRVVVDVKNDVVPGGVIAVLVLTELEVAGLPIPWAISSVTEKETITGMAKPPPITIVRGYVHRRRERLREMFVPLRHDPGHAQVDFVLRSIWLRDCAIMRRMARFCSTKEALP